MWDEVDEKIWDAHEEACRIGRPVYDDPLTGYNVMTRPTLRARGRCCGAGCRHCPYRHREVPPDFQPPQAGWLHETAPPHQACDVLFWSGGKDSFATFLHLRQQSDRPVVWLTTHDAESGHIAHQDLHITQVRAQAEQLQVDALQVPLARGGAYQAQLERALHVIQDRRPIRRLVFGDLHLEDIRSWREKILGPIATQFDATLAFPLWHRDYAELLDMLEGSGAHFRISASRRESDVQIGTRWDRKFIAQLPADIDPFGEHGEFHTHVEWT